MHNGSMATLDDVIDFYADDSGRAHGVENMDLLVQKIELSQQERSDLIAFLMALTDESNSVEIPTSVPSGLTVTKSPGGSEPPGG